MRAKCGPPIGKYRLLWPLITVIIATVVVVVVLVFVVIIIVAVIVVVVAAATVAVVVVLVIVAPLNSTVVANGGLKNRWKVARELTRESDRLIDINKWLSTLLLH